MRSLLKKYSNSQKIGISPAGPGQRSGNSDYGFKKINWNTTGLYDVNQYGGNFHELNQPDFRCPRTYYSNETF